ncbi:MAG: DEAD/DEAH box helicase, partial [Bdellovibrionales bacterium]|nr:DEAD/DEAH box helicase [Bdellovibrionales bacterium]
MRYLGLTGAAKGWFIAQHLPKEGPCVILTKEKRQAVELKEDLQFFRNDIPFYDFPDWETLPFEPVSPGSYLCAQRIGCLRKLIQNERVVIITHAHALLNKLPQPDLLLSPSLSLVPEMNLSKAELEHRLCILGYEKVSLVEEVGEYALRGGVIDFYPGLLDHPVRCEFLSDHIHRLQLFDSQTQRSIDDLSHIDVLPVSEFIYYPFYQKLNSQVDEAIARIKERAKHLECPPREVVQYIHELRNAKRPAGAEVLQSLYLPMGNFFDYCSVTTPFIFVDELGITQTVDTAWEQITERESRLGLEHYLIPSKEQAFLEGSTLLQESQKRCSFALDEIELLTSTPANDREETQQKIVSFKQTELATRLKTSIGTGDAFRPLKEAIERWRKDNFRIGFVVGSEQRARRLERTLLDLGYDAPFEPHLSGSDWAQGLKRTPLAILLGHLSSGTQIPSEKLSLVAESEIFGERSYRHSQKAETNIKKLLGSLSQLKENDYVVHSEYGIGIYRGFTHMEVEGIGSDLLQIEYADSLLYLPLTNVCLLQRFSGAEGQAPTIDKLSSQKWKKTKQKVRDSVATLAGELIRLYAARSLTKGWQYPESNADDEIFADGFPYSETEDQLKAIEETLADMSSDRPMDRLVCGDVGFGKTEIALRAAYKATQDGKQVAILAPTTILVEQHRETFQKRFRDFPVRVGAVSRFYPPKKNKLILQELGEGKVDVILGTHKLLQRDVTFRDLGLLIVDEEHRFGVKQKEKLKQFRKDIDVLTLTATPIPRTLHMSLLDLRDISVISTPPIDRRTVRTYVAAKDETLIHDAIMRELQRGGQCFYVHNRVQSIDLVTSELKDLVPEARFEYAHGQMPEHQ